MEQEIDLIKVWEIVKKHRLLIIILPLLVAIISGGISFCIIRPVYQSSTTLIVGRKAADLEEQSARQLLENNVLSANRQLAKTYGEIVKSRTVREQVIAELKIELTADQLNKKVSVSQVKDTEILQISVTDTDPILASNIANVTVEKFNDAVMEIKKVESVSIVDKAIPPAFPVKPNKLMIIIIAYVVGLFGAFGFSVLLEFFNNTIQSSKEAEELLGLSVLGVIMEYKVEEQKGREPCANTV